MFVSAVQQYRACAGNVLKAALFRLFMFLRRPGVTTEAIWAQNEHASFVAYVETTRQRGFKFKRRDVRSTLGARRITDERWQFWSNLNALNFFFNAPSGS